MKDRLNLRIVTNEPAEPEPERVFPHDPAHRGYNVTYRRDQRNRCPGCGREHWLVGRLMAECAFCGTAVPLAESAVGAGIFRTSKHYTTFEEAIDD